MTKYPRLFLHGETQGNRKSRDESNVRLRGDREGSKPLGFETTSHATLNQVYASKHH